jgi:hypothetical protein
MAAPTVTAPILTGAPRPVRVALTTPHAIYLATDDADTPALCLADPIAVRVPCALVLGGPLPALDTAAGQVGQGVLTLGSHTFRVARWWRPPRPRRVTAAARAALRSRVPATSTRLDPETLIGRGPGLTPLGDDILAGALVTLAALDSPEFGPLAGRVRAGAPGRTTFVSQALLHHATRGECIPELAALLTATDPEPALDTLLRVGGTSGTGLARGALAALSPDTVPSGAATSGTGRPGGSVLSGRWEASA